MPKKTAPKANARPPRKKTIKITATNRAKVDPATGKILSRRQFDKKYPPRSRTSLQKGYNPRKYRADLHRYKSVRDAYIEKQKREGKKISKREAMNSSELKQIVRDLKSKNPARKAKALERAGRITPDQVEHYSKLFSDEGET
jgi:hypothetical protein